MACYFLSDNTASVSPEILAALTAANTGPAKAYGEDAWTSRLNAVLGAFFEHEVAAFPVATGTAANALSLATLVPPYGSIYAHEEAHILRDECGAPEFYTGGARIVAVAGPDGKLIPEALEAALDRWTTSLHNYQPSAIALTQASELGTVYRPAEIAALSALAHARKLHVQMDGARFANALVSLDCAPAEITWRAGVDVLSFGATKNGAMAAEAVVFFDPQLARDFELRRKRGGHLLSKSRYVSAQLLAYVETGLWQRNARHANRCAARLGAAGATYLMHPVQANEVFLRLGDARKQDLRAAGFHFYDWGAERSGEARLVTSWNQDERDVEALCDALAAL